VKPLVNPLQRFFYTIYNMKTIFSALFLLISTFGFAQQSEIEAITKTVNLYFDGMVNRDPAMLEEAFHPDARLIGFRGEKFTVTPFETWAAGTASGSIRNPLDFKNTVKAIRVEGYTAIVETELFWPGIYYYDFLTLIKVDEKWKIVHKTWYEEIR
jgi:hypothetical protein